FPVVEHLRQLGFPQPYPLPGGEIQILQRQWLEPAVALGGDLQVGGGQFADQQAHGPAVGDDVVDDDAEDVFVVVQAEQVGAEQRPLFEGERGHQFNRGAAQQFVFGVGGTAQIADG